MKLRWLGALAVVAAVGVSSSGDTPAPDAKITPVFFNHKDHEGYGVKTSECAQCHSVDKNDAVAVPGANGHQPCQSSGCHNTWFLSAGMPSDKNYARAAAFCLGCHDTPDVKPPKASQKMPAVFKSSKAEIEFHVEMPGPDDPATEGRGSHFAHVDKKQTRQDCRSCHIVQKGGLLEPGTPGHGQCVVCHGKADREKGTVRISMEQCDKCHRSGPRPSPWTEAAGSRHGDDTQDNVTQKTTTTHATSVRSCTSEAYLHLTDAKFTKHPEKIPCFKHERPEHRFKDYSASTPKEEVQCSQCHYMIDDQSTWARMGRHVQYYSLDDIHKFPIISNSMNEEHQACGAGQKGCHSRDIPSQGQGRCELCHAGQETSAF